MFSLLGIPYLDAPGEAEQQCVLLVKKNVCDVCNSYTCLFLVNNLFNVFFVFFALFYSQ